MAKGHFPMKTTWRFLLFVCVLMSGYVAVSGQVVGTQRRGYSLPAGASYLPGVVCVRIDNGYRQACQDDQLLLEGWAALTAPLGQVEVRRMFPQVQPPRDRFDKFGHELEDLSLIYYIAYDPARPIQEVIDRLLGHPAVQYAEPIFTHELCYQPNDPFADTTGGIDYMWHLDQIRAREAWDISQGDTSVVVAIVDSGVEKDHPDLQANRAINGDDPIDGLDNDQDGWIDNYFGWDFGGSSLGTAGDNMPFARNPHGHWVTGIVGATPDNNIGIPSLCFHCRYLPVKAAPDDSIGSIFYGYQGIVYAAEMGARVINCSWGSPFQSELGRNVVRYVTRNKGAVVVAAAGNSTSDTKYYPAAYEEVLSVANITYEDVLCCNSTYNYSIDVGAPGWNVYSTIGATGYAGWSGTSASAPVAAGAVALVLAHFPHYTGFQAAQRVRITADDLYAINPAYVNKLGNGRVNMYRALTDPAKPAIRQEQYELTDTDGDGVHAPGDTLLLRFTFRNHLEPATNLRVGISLPGFFVNFAEVIDSVLDIGALGTLAAAQSGDAFRIRLKPGVPEDFNLAVRLHYSDPVQGYTDFEVAEQRINTSYLHVDVNNLHTTITSRGGIGFSDFLFQEQGLGIQYRNQRNAMFEGGLLLGDSPARVSDHIRNGGSRDSDFRVLTPLRRQWDSPVAPFYAEGVFDDFFSPQAIGLEVRQQVIAYTDTPNTDFVLLRYIVRAPGGGSLSNLYAGIFTDWDIAPFFSNSAGGIITRNAASYNDTARVAYAYDRTGADQSYYGLRLIGRHSFRSFAAILPGGLPFNAAGKYAALANVPSALTATAGTNNSGGDVIQYISGGPFALAGGVADTLVFALMAAPSRGRLLQNGRQAAEVYRCRVLGEGPVLDFLASDTLVAPGTAVVFSDLNAGAAAWQWDLGDGSSAATAQVQHSYAAPGSYTVQLQVTQAGCSETYRRQVVVEAAAALDEALPRWHVALAPNPAFGQAHLTLHGPVQGPVEIRLCDLAGRVLMAQQTYKRQPAETWHIEVPATPGLYLLDIRLGDERQVQRVIVGAN
ncbi:MAG: hypothetical protein OHK0039_14070 [Bacteroidia bacterium]